MEAGLSLLRIKRKRGAEPLHALVLQDSPSKRRRQIENQPAVFRFAETVSSDSFASPSQTKALGQRITALATSNLATTSKGALVSTLPAATDQSEPASTRFRVIPKQRAAFKPGNTKVQREHAMQILDAEQDTLDLSSPAAVLSAPVMNAPLASNDTTMDNFVPLLKEYLSCEFGSSDHPLPETADSQLQSFGLHSKRGSKVGRIRRIRLVG